MTFITSAPVRMAGQIPSPRTGNVKFGIKETFDIRPMTKAEIAEHNRRELEAVIKALDSVDGSGLSGMATASYHLDQIWDNDLKAEAVTRYIRKNVLYGCLLPHLFKTIVSLPVEQRDAACKLLAGMSPYLDKSDLYARLPWGPRSWQLRAEMKQLETEAKKR